jgi:minor extracellular protease Epr
VVHGTAVASVIAGAAEESAGRVSLSKLRAASVFFRDGDGQVRATTAGLVAALDWLAGAPDLRVVNMSLAGPPNRLLEVALADVAMHGVIVVAAVGNNGPTGGPLYPAAYDTVVGVTAVDSGHRVYRYANRGRQVMFSALGVQVAVATPGGGFSTQSGTSLASPRVAALLGETIAAGSLSSAAAVESLQTAALDLGDSHYDEVYGYGLVRRKY